MSDDSFFLDTNVFVYSLELDLPEKSNRCGDLIDSALGSGAGITSYQVVQEFVAVARRRFQHSMTVDELERYWQITLRPLLHVHSSVALFSRALDLTRRDRLAWYDALIVAAAIQGRCKILYSEDLQHGRRFGDLVVQNPFV